MYFREDGEERYRLFNLIRDPGELADQSAEKEKVVKLNEVRILMVGDGMAGKTSLLKQIQALKFNAHHENARRTRFTNKMRK